VGWTLCPAAHILIPDVVDCYYRTATPADDFIGAVSGIGYTYPDLYGKRYRNRQAVYDGFLAQTAEYLRRSDLKQVWIMNATQPEVIARYAEKVTTTDGLFPDYGARVMGYDEATYLSSRNVPVFHAVTGWRMDATREERIAQMVADIRKFTPERRPAFLDAFLLNWFTDMPMLTEVARRLGPDYVIVRPDHLAALMTQDAREQQLLVRFPRTVSCVEGQPFALAGTLRNATDTPFGVTIALTGGLDKASVQPKSVTLPSAGGSPLTITGLPSAREATIDFRGPFGTRTETVPLRLIPAAEVLGKLALDKPLIQEWWAEAEDLPHRSGEHVVEPEASGSAIWRAVRSKTEPGYLVFGPYAPLAAGDYLVAFRIRRTSAGSGPLADLDVAVSGGARQVALKHLTGRELPPKQWRWVFLPFRHPGGSFETRINWPGTISMDMDAISIWRR
jgi:hypothetical protein